MARLVAKSLGVKLELVPVPAASRIPFLLTDKSDMNIACGGAFSSSSVASPMRWMP